MAQQRSSILAPRTTPNLRRRAWLVVLGAFALGAALVTVVVVSLLRNHTSERVPLWVVMLAAAPLAGSALMATLRRWRALAHPTSHAPLSPSGSIPPHGTPRISPAGSEPALDAEGEFVDPEAREGATAAIASALPPSVAGGVTNWSSNLG
jgi:hypothetical protein